MMSSPDPKRRSSASNDPSASKKKLSSIIQSEASNSGVGHLVGIAEQSNRKPMREQINDLKQEITNLGLAHLIDINSGVGMQSELKMLKGILAAAQQQQQQTVESSNGNTEQNIVAPVEESSSPEPKMKETQTLLVPRRSSFARELVSQATTMGIHTTDTSSPFISTSTSTSSLNSQSLPRANSGRRLSTVIKSVASNSGVGHLVGIAEQSNRKPMKEQVEDLKQELTNLGLAHLIQEDKVMSLSMQIKELKKILSEHQPADYVPSIQETQDPPPPTSVGGGAFNQIPRRDSFAKQLVTTAKTMGIETSDSHPSPPHPASASSSTSPSISKSTSNSPSLPRTNANTNTSANTSTNATRRLSTVIKSVASNSGVGHLVGIAEQSNRKPMKEQVEDLKQELTNLGLAHLIQEDKVMSLSAQIKELKRILSEHQSANSKEKDESHPEDVVQNTQPFQKTKQFIPFPKFNEIDDESHDNLDQFDENDEALELLHEEIEKLKTKLTEKDSLIEMQRDEILRIQTINDENSSLLSLQSELLNEQSTANPNLNDLMKQKLVFELKDKFSEDLQHQFDELQLHHQELKEKYEKSLLTIQRNEVQVVRNVTPEEMKQEPSKEINVEEKMEDREEKEKEKLKECQACIQTQIELKNSQLVNQELSSQLEHISSNAEILIGEMEKYLREKTELEQIISRLQEEIKKKKKESESQTENLQKANDELSQINVSNTTLLSSMKSQIEAIQSELLVCKENNTSLQQQLNSLQQENNKLNENLSIALSREASSSSDSVSLQSQYESMINDKDSKILELTNSLNELQPTLLSMKSQIEAAQSELLVCKENNTSLQGQLNSLQQENNKLNENLSIALSREASSSSDSVSLQSQYESMINDKDSKILELSNTLNELQPTLLSTNTLLKKREEELTIITLDVQTLAMKNNSYLEEINQQKEVISSLTSRLTSLEEGLQQANHENSNINQRFNEKIASLNTSLFEATSTIEKMTENLQEHVKKEIKYTRDIQELNELLSEQNQFLSDAAESLDVAEEEIDDFERELLTSQAEVKRLKQIVNEMNEEKESSHLKQQALEAKIVKLQKENHLLHEQQQQHQQQFQSPSYDFDIHRSASGSSSIASSVTASMYKKNPITASIYSGQTKSIIPLSAYIQLQKDNQKLLLKLSQQNHQINDLTEILNTTFRNKEKVYKKFQTTSKVDVVDSTDSSQSAEKSWLEMNQIPVFSGYNYLCNSYSNRGDGNIFTKIHYPIKKHRDSISTTISNSTSASVTGTGTGAAAAPGATGAAAPGATGGGTPNSQFTIELQSASVPLSPNEEYLKEAIRRMRIGWTLIKIDKFDRREVIVHFDIQEKLLKFLSLRMDKDFQSQLCDTEIYLSAIAMIKKTNEKGESTHTAPPPPPTSSPSAPPSASTTTSATPSPTSCISFICKSEEILILKFVASEERDYFYDGLLCTWCHIDQSFRQNQILNFVDIEDIPTSRYLKGNFVKKPNGEYVMLSFNRRSLLRHQSSIAVLQSAGIFSPSESTISEFLNSKEGGMKMNVEQHPPPLDTSMIDFSIEQITSPSVVSRTLSSSSVISGVTILTDVNLPHDDVTPKEIKKVTATPTSSSSTTSMIANFGMFRSQTPTNSETKEDDDLSDLGSLYGGGTAAENRPVKKTFFSNKSTTTTQNNVNRMTFSHENPISLNSAENTKTMSKSQSLGTEGSTTTATGTAVGGGGGSGLGGGLGLSGTGSGSGGGGIGPSSKKLTHSRSSFSINPRTEKPPSHPPPSQSSVGAENASRFMKRRTSSLEGRPSEIKIANTATNFSNTNTSTDSSQQSPTSSGSASVNGEEEGNTELRRHSRHSSDKLRRRGSASSLLAHQTAQFRKKVTDQLTNDEIEI